MTEKSRIIYVIGVCACGKSTIGKELAKHIRWNFKDGDDFHTPENMEKMSRGIALVDSDRQPWLNDINNYAKTHPNTVIACSALKKSYRRVLNLNIDAKFILLNISRDILEMRVHSRPNHFIDPSLLQSQIDTLEMPNSAEEPNVIVINANSSNIEDIIKNIVDKIEF